MQFKIDREKLAEVTEIINRDTDPRATEELIETEICADWNEGDEHQEWLDNADADEIASWLKSFYGND
jgi:hypothetical protein